MLLSIRYASKVGNIYILVKVTKTNLPAVCVSLLISTVFKNRFINQNIISINEAEDFREMSKTFQNVCQQFICEFSSRGLNIYNLIFNVESFLKIKDDFFSVIIQTLSRSLLWATLSPSVRGFI